MTRLSKSAKIHKERLRLIIDEKPAQIISRMFDMFASGDSGRHISDIFNKEGIPSPRAYFYQQVGRENPLNESMTWNSNTLMEIENASVDISAWAKEFKQYTNIDKLNRKIVTKLIDSVEVHESTKENGVIKQHVTVNYKFVGQLSA